MDFYPKLNLAFLDEEEEFEEELSDRDETATLPVAIKGPSVMLITASKLVPTKPIAIEPTFVIVAVPSLDDSAARAEPSSNAINLMEKVRS